MTQLRTASGADLPLRILFEHPSVAALAGALDALAWSAARGTEREARTADSHEREVVEL
jgi:hypothetical protein